MPPGPAAQTSQDTTHMLSEGHHRSGVGPIIGAFIVLVILAFGALYFYGEYLNRQNADEQLPFIQGEVAI